MLQRRCNKLTRVGHVYSGPSLTMTSDNVKKMIACEQRRDNKKGNNRATPRMRKQLYYCLFFIVKQRWDNRFLVRISAILLRLPILYDFISKYEKLVEMSSKTGGLSKSVCILDKRTNRDAHIFNISPLVYM